MKPFELMTRPAPEATNMNSGGLCLHVVGVFRCDLRGVGAGTSSKMSVPLQIRTQACVCLGILSISLHWVCLTFHNLRLPSPGWFPERLVMLMRWPS